MYYYRNPEDEDNEDEDEGEEELGGLMNWPPSRGAIDPHLPRRTFLPAIKRDSTFHPLPKQPTIKAIQGEWIVPYRAKTVRSLNLEQADRILQASSASEDGASYWDFDRDNLPTLYVDVTELPTDTGMFSLPNPYRLVIAPMNVKSVLTGLKGKVRKTHEYLTMSPGYVLYALAKELEKIYEKNNLEGFQNLYFQKLDISLSGQTAVQYKLHKTPKEIALGELPNIVHQDLLPEGGIDTPRPFRGPTAAKLSRANARKVRACGLDGMWTTGMSPDVVTVAGLTLQQAHELLFVSQRAQEEVREGHPLFMKLRARVIKRQEHEVPLDEEHEEEESDIPDELRAKMHEVLAEFEMEEDDDDGPRIEDQVRFRCPFCGAFTEGSCSYQDEGEVIEEVAYRNAQCNKCEKEWKEPAEEIYIRRYESSRFQNWLKCRGNDAPTLVVEINYPLSAVVRITIPPATFETDLGSYQIMSPGYLMWVVAKEYRRIYANHEHYGIWGHGIADLVIEGFQISEDGNTHLLIGS